ncbi:MAG: rhamnulose-1-phosphate aldolase [Bacteroidales bacterium]|nr:rhamnulose-1-phosphate aldolase [Bacteroidales bacterium]
MALKYNGPLQMQINDIAQVAEYMWEKGWAERNAGNISVNITELVGKENRNLPVISKTPLQHVVPELDNQYYYVTAAGSRMRDIARNPMDQGIVVRVTEEGSSIETLADKDLPPTMELPSHLLMHRVFAKEALSNNLPVSSGRRLVFHTHPTELIALSHIKALQSSKAVTETLYRMHPEVTMCIPDGVCWIPYQAPGSIELAKASIKDLTRYSFMLWEHHGILATGTDILDVFDAVDTLNKAAKIYFYIQMQQK